MKKKRFITIAIIIFIIALVTIGGVFLVKLLNEGSLGGESYRLVKVEEYDGNVDLTRDHDNVEIFEGLNLIPRDFCSTKTDSSLLLLMDEDKHVLASENTSFSVIAKGNVDDGKIKIKLEEGEGLFTINEKLNKHDEFEVETPNALLSVRGTKFLVRYDVVLSMTYVEVYEGKVWVKGADQEIILEVGDYVYIYDDELLFSCSDDSFNALLDKYDNVLASYQDSYDNYSSYQDLFSDDVVIFFSDTLISLDAYSDLNQDDLSEDDVLAIMDKLDEIQTSIDDEAEYINGVIELYEEELASAGAWKQVYKDFASSSSDDSWLLFDVYGDETPELMYYSSNNSGNGRWGDMIFYTYDGAGGVVELGSYGWEVNQNVGVLDGQPVVRFLSGGTGDWDVYKLSVTDGSVSTGGKLGSGGYKTIDDWVSICGGSEGEWALWHSPYANGDILEAIDNYE